MRNVSSNSIILRVHDEISTSAEGRSRSDFKLIKCKTKKEGDFGKLNIYSGKSQNHSLIVSREYSDFLN